jgi:glycosyltransferase involved in cell wall biosynthesis
MKICMLSKYPPIEGGVSSRAYWIAKALGELGHEVHVVTNALEVEEEYREEFDLNDPNYQPKNVYIHSTDPSPTVEANPSHIPFSKMYCEKLASLAIKIIEDYNIDLIDSRYLVPYCVAGYIAKTMTGIPQIISHTGSDLQRLYPSPYLNSLLDKVLQKADKIVTTTDKKSFITNLGIPVTKISTLPQVYVDINDFKPHVEIYNLKYHITNQKYTSGTPVIGYIGKITHNFETKGLPELLNACSKISKEFLLLFIANGNKIEEFKALINKEGLTEKTLLMPFLPPWKIPSLLKSCTCVVSLENSGSPVLSYHVPVVPAEAIATGRCVLMSEELHKKEPYTKLKDGKEVLVVNSKDVNKIKETLETLIQKPSIAEKIGANSFVTIDKCRSIVDCAEKTIQIYRSILHS